MNKKINPLMMFLFAVSFLLCQGCVALVVGAGAGAAGIAFVKGALEKNFDKTVEEVYKASLPALDKLKIEIDKKSIDPHRGLIKGHDQKRNGVTVEIEALTEKASKLKIRVGVFGNQEQSLAILNAIEKRL